VGVAEALPAGEPATDGAADLDADALPVLAALAATEAEDAALAAALAASDAAADALAADVEAGVAAMDPATDAAAEAAGEAAALLPAVAACDGTTTAGDAATLPLAVTVTAAGALALTAPLELEGVAEGGTNEGLGVTLGVKLPAAYASGSICSSSKEDTR
jgi:hypothetical protein